MTDNLAQLLVERAEERPGLRLGTVDNQRPLRDVLRVAAGGAAMIGARCAGPHRRAAIIAGSSTSYLVAWMACVLARTPVALINPTYPTNLLTSMLDELDPACVLTDHLDLPALGDRPTVALSEVEAWPAGEPQECPGLRADGHEIASFMHTSGTTGAPKFCAQTHSYFLRLGHAIADALELTARDRVLAPLPMFHINPLGYGIVGALTAGADALSVRTFAASTFWTVVREQRITVMILHAPPVEILKRATAAEDSHGHHVRTMFYADREFMLRFGVSAAVSGYGSTEAAGVSHLRRWSLAEEIPHDASRRGGRTRGDLEDRIGADGEIFVRERSPGALFAGYFGKGELNRARDPDGWFATGDLGARDQDGGLVFLERAAESIRVKGEFVPIPFVESHFAAIRELEDLALWRKPAALVDDELVLYVVADNVPVRAIAQAAAQLPSFMRPTQVAQIGAIPRDAAAGKVRRRLLDEQEIRSWTTLS